MQIATAKTARTKVWKNTRMTWEELSERLASPRIVHLTLKEYQGLSKAKQGEIKDVGGYVGGLLKDGLRKIGHVQNRSIVTLDIDDAPMHDILERVDALQCRAIVHSTFKHTADNPRYRIVLQLDNTVTAEQYQAIARKVAADLGIEQFDPTTFEPHRLMYWPAHPSDGEFFFREYDYAPLDTVATLDYYLDWSDSTEWPTRRAADAVFTNKLKKQSDPSTKAGVIGAFCREYSITEAIDTFLADVYKPTAHDNRYTYTGGETAAGLIVYEDKWAYSHHGTDPASGKECNAFDLVRIHTFGELDVDSDPTTATQSLPSFKAMLEKATNDHRVAELLLEERRITAADFAEADDSTETPTPQEPTAKGKKSPKSKRSQTVDTEWRSKLEKHHKTGVVESTANNITLILRHDEAFKNKLRFNEFDQRKHVFGDLPWRKIKGSARMEDDDYSGVRVYLETMYGIQGKQKIDDALALEFKRNKYNPLTDYLESLKWDGVQRLDTFLIDYFAAADTCYTRAVTRKTLTAAITRAYHPGCKFDYMLILVGDQGAGKSQLGKALCCRNEEWFTDNFELSSKDNKMAEQIQGVWITEMPEMTGFSKADVNAIKSFVTRQRDEFRPAYGREKVTYYRQGIMLGTTNETEFLRDPTGDRRYWPVTIDKNAARKRIFDISPEEVDQVWAEAKHCFENGEKLYLMAQEEMEATLAQRMHTIRDHRQGVIEQYLDAPLHPEWETMDVLARRMWLDGEDWKQEEWKHRKSELLTREVVCTAEIWCECFGKSPEEMDRYRTREINDVMRGHPEWSFNASTKSFGEYGRQKHYVKRID